MPSPLKAQTPPYTYRLFLLSTPFPDCDPVEAPGDRTFFLLRFVDEAISSLIGLQILSQSTRKSSVSGA